LILNYISKKEVGIKCFQQLNQLELNFRPLPRRASEVPSQDDESGLLGYDTMQTGM
jgi:hypothetical protein